MMMMPLCKPSRLGFLRRRLIPTSLPDTSCLDSNPSERFEIKVYEIDDTQRVRKRTELMTAEVMNATC